MFYLEQKLVRVNAVLAQIEDTQPNLRAKKVLELQEEMFTIENEVLKKNQEMKLIDEKVRVALKNAIDLDGLSHKIFQKYFNFIQNQINITVEEREAFIPLSVQRRGLLL